MIVCENKNRKIIKRQNVIKKNVVFLDMQIFLDLYILFHYIDQGINYTNGEAKTILNIYLYSYLKTLFFEDDIKRFNYDFFFTGFDNTIRIGFYSLTF